MRNVFETILESAGYAVEQIEQGVLVIRPDRDVRCSDVETALAGRGLGGLYELKPFEQGVLIPTFEPVY